MSQVSEADPTRLTTEGSSSVKEGEINQAPSPVAVKKKVVVPGAGSVLGGGALPMEPSIADHIGAGIRASHTLKDRALMLKHANLRPNEQRAVAACEMVREGLLNFAMNEDPNVVIAAMKDDHGWTLANPKVLENGNLTLSVVCEMFLTWFYAASDAVPNGKGGNKADKIESMAKAFGANDAEATKLDKVKSFFGRGSSK